MDLNTRLKTFRDRARLEIANESKTSLFRQWLVPIGITAGLGISFFLFLRFMDYSLTQNEVPLFDVLFLTDPGDVGDSIGGVAEVLVATLGLVITVVAIVVQLAAQRYTPKLVDLFIADRLNILYFLLMVVATTYSLLLNYTITENFLPFWGSLFLLLLTTIILSLLAPYFSYVFLFLTPSNIIRIIRHNGRKGMTKVLHQKLSNSEVIRTQEEVANAMEQISDIALSAVSQMDRNVALMAIRTLKEVMVDHMLLKPQMVNEWFVPQERHFPAISTDFLSEIQSSRNWVEAKGFMDMELIFKMAIQEMPDAVSAVANNARAVGLHAIKTNDNPVLADVVQFFNTFLRISLNNRNPKAIYNLFYQYRLLAEEVLPYDQAMGERIAFYFKYYGNIAQNYNIPLILITACFDLSTLLRSAYDQKVPNMERLVDTFLELDDNLPSNVTEFDLRSVRKAQLMFASFLHSRNDKVHLPRIANDLLEEPKDRLDSIRNEMLRVTDRKFWEVTDRGVDFFYMDDTQKNHLNGFFEEFLMPHFAAKPPQAPPTGAPS